ncbi:alpha/beta hydrolase family protein [candidate division KSB1 bacterium]
MLPLKKTKRHLSNYILLSLIFLVSNTIFVTAQEENFNVFNRWNEWSNGGNMLLSYINNQAFKYLDVRDNEISKLKTKADWINRQRNVKDILMKIVGPFPEKTPLNPKITGVIKKNGYRIEKIIYESIPNYYVTGCIFIPDGIVKKRPAILNVLGHWDKAFRAEGPQQFIYNLVKKGFIVFAIDPVGQGERLQYYDPEKKEFIMKEPTTEHSYVGNQCFLCGVSPGRYFAWDGIRGIDYLLTRSEVDPERIGITGISGGGTQTSYIAAFDERIKAVAPTCYITGFRRLLESIGAQDAEQNFYHAVSNGITHADFLEVNAPKPTLIAATTRDFFSIQGARETFHEVSKAYKALGNEGNLSMVEDDSEHGYTRKVREGIYAFFQKYLDLPGSPTEEDVEILEEHELNVTPTGLVSTYLDGGILFNVNKKEAQKLIKKIENSRQSITEHLNNVKKKAKELSGYAVPYNENETVFRGSYQREGYSIEMYVLKGESEYVIPLLLFVPNKSGKFPAVLYIHPEGKSSGASRGGQIEELVKKGFIVAAPDVIGIGETKYTFSRSIHPINYGAVLIGRSIVGFQAGDIVRVVNFLKTRNDVTKDKIGAIAVDEMCPALLHAAVFDESIGSVVLLDSPISYSSIVMNKYYEYNFSGCVAGALTAYDLPDLIGCVSPRKLILAGVKDQMKQSASKELINKELEFPRSVLFQDL